MTIPNINKYFVANLSKMCNINDFFCTFVCSKAKKVK